MSGLAYVGKLPTNPTDITNRLATNNALASATPNTASVQSQIASAIAGTYATQLQVNNLTATFTTTSYYQTQDALNIPLTQVGVAGGVATLNAQGTVPLTQLPPSGAGYVLGPFGPTGTSSSVSTGTTPVQIAYWQLPNPINYQFRLECYFSAFVNALMGHPIIEIRVANIPSTGTAPTYTQAGTLVALGQGRNLYNDYAPVECVPVPDATSETPSLLPTNYTPWITAWLKDNNNSNNTASVQLTNGNIANAAVYVIRGAA